jgi:hypothetical protein
MSCAKEVDGTLSNEQMDSFKKNVLIEGDKYSYSRLLINRNGTKNDYELIPYSLIMADEYNNADAHKYIFYDFIRIYNNGIYKPELIVNLDNKNKSFALYHLLKASKLGDSDCIKIIKEDYKNYNITEKSISNDSILNLIK